MDRFDELELRGAIERRDATIRILERDLHEAERENRALREALSEAVEKYGKPGGPWNVPNEPGCWIEKAKKALKGGK